MQHWRRNKTWSRPGGDIKTWSRPGGDIKTKT
jgi:hypothetical protein